MISDNKKTATTSISGFWSNPWRFRQAISVTVLFVATAVILQVLFPYTQVRLPGAPWNWITVSIPIVFAMIIARIRPYNTVLAGLGGIPMAIVSILALSLASLPSGIWPLGANAPGWMHRLGISQLFASLPFAAAMILVMLNLSLAVGRRLFPKKKGDVTFMLIHLGLLLSLAGAVAGTGTLLRAHVTAFRDAEFTNLAQKADDEIRLPFAIKLENFIRDTFPPRLRLAERVEGSQDKWLTQSGQEFIERGVRERIGNYTVEVLEYMPSAAIMAGQPREFSHAGTGPAVKVRVYDSEGDSIDEGWLHSEGRFGEELFLRLSEDYILTLQPPQPKKYASEVAWITSDSTEPNQALISVNKPLTIGPWKVYQHSYDRSMGSASSYSIFEVVYDPMMPVVFAGIYMLIAGVIIHFWTAAKRLVVGPGNYRKAAK